MVKMMFLCRRRPDVDHVRYVAMVLDDHVPLALRHHPTMRTYVVNIVDRSPEGWPVLDSVAALGFDSVEDYRDRLYDSDAGRLAIGRDVARFMGGAAAYVTREHVQRDTVPPVPPGTRTPMLKLVCPVRRRPDMTHDAFVTHWLERHVPLALRHHPGLVRYVTNVVEQSLEDAAPLDGIAELCFADEASLRSGMFDSPEGERLVREDIARFIGATAAYQTSEWVQKR